MLRSFDGIAEDGRQFLVNLQPKLRPNLSIQDWIEIVWIQFIDQASEWINNVKEIMDMIEKGSSDEADKTRFVQLICEKYSAVKELVVAKKSVAKLIDMQQGQNETVRKYYLRIHDALVTTGDDILLSTVIRNWINGLNNKKLARHLVGRSTTMQSLFDAYTIAERKLRQKEERRRQKEDQLALQQQLQDIVDREVARTQISYESLHFLEQIRPEVLEICTAADITDTETPARSTASEYAKWIIASTSLQKPSPEVSFVDESLPILEQMPCNLSEINDDVDTNDTESIDEVLASGPGKWIAATAGKEVFGYTSTSDEAAKNPPAPDTESASDTSFGWSRCCTVDMEVLNQEVFALAAIYDAFSKNSPALSPEDLEISVAMDMPSPKHLMDMNGPAIEAFDSGTAMGATSKNPSIQQTEDSETTEKTAVSAFIDSTSDSVCTYELPALPAFDHSIDIDFEAYTIATSVVQPSVASSRTFRDLALRHNSFGWSRCCTNPIGSRTSVSTCTSAPAVTATTSGVAFITSDVTLDSIETAKTVDTDFYGGEQSLCSSVDDIVDAVCTAVVVEDTDAPTLTAGLVNTTKNSARMSLLGPVVDLAPKPKHKGLPKVKIK
ncbi:hypothetical protein G7Y79_00026g059320 [Physcia stellaris]|nr:hypothetical protein G7Y79_00026g059320 [Physcia stellaris]